MTFEHPFNVFSSQNGEDRREWIIADFDARFCFEKKRISSKKSLINPGYIRYLLNTPRCWLLAKGVDDGNHKGRNSPQPAKESYFYYIIMINLVKEGDRVPKLPIGIPKE